MDKPIDSLITNTFERRMREASRIAREFKAPQVTSGASGQLGYAIENNVTWDRTETLPNIDPNNPPYTGTADYVVTFTSDGSQQNPIAIPFTDIRVNGTGDGNVVKYRWNYSAFVYGDPPTVWVFVYDEYIADSVMDETQTRWLIKVVYNGNPTLRFKLKARASSPGSLSIARIA